MTMDEQEQLLVEHIPYKLAAIDLCRYATTLLGRRSGSHATTIRIDGLAEIRLSDMSVFTNGVVEHGFMSCRAMLEFLGIGLDRAQTGLEEYRRHRADTLTLKHFNLDLITVKDVTRHLGSDNVLLDGLVQTIRAAHKGGAHLTIGGEKLKADPLAAGCRATRRLVDHFLYERLGRAAPVPRLAVDGANAI